MSLPLNNANRESEPVTRLAVLIFTDIVGSTDMKSKIGTAGYAKLLARHNELFESGASQIAGAEIIKHTGDGYFASFVSASDAVRFALVFQSRMAAEPWQPQAISTRVGVHVGEVQFMDMAGRQDLIGLSADVAARLMSLAQGGQILLTSQAFNDARQFVNRTPEAIDGAPPLQWLAHGPYLFKGADEPMAVYEVGVEGCAPLVFPPDSEKARRVVAHDQEPTLGWRPAAGMEIPSRAGWVLEKKLGEGGFGEVWLGVHRKLNDRRVFKFCFDADRLRSLKREFTLFRLLRQALGQREDIATLHEVKLDEPPFFLESEYIAGGNLIDWPAGRGGVDKMPLDERFELVAKAADAVAAAHSVGILHKDIKPSNILIREEADGTVHPVLSDFGIGFLADRTRLAEHNITAAGFTQFTEENDSSRTGTRMYAPPETLAGKPFTTKGDVYALGVLLYQMAVGDLSRPLAAGWERDVPDELLRADIAACVEGDPDRRLSGAETLSEQLRGLASRRLVLAEERQSVQRARRRRAWARFAGAAAALLAIVAAGFGVAFVRERGLLNQIVAEKYEAQRQRDEATRQRDNAQAVLSFLTQDVLAKASPKSMLDKTIRDTVVHSLIEPAAATVSARFQNKPEIEATLRNLFAVILDDLGQANLALPHAEAALNLRKKALGKDHPDTIDSLNSYANVLAALGRAREAEPLFKQALDQRRSLLGENHPDTIISLNNYAFMLASLDGRAQDAEPLFKLALDQRRKSLGENNPDTITSLSNYASVLNSLGRAQEAEPLVKQALYQRLKSLGDNHPDTLTSENNYAVVLELLGREREAEPLYKDALDRRRRTLGVNHPATIESLNNYASILSLLGRAQEAEPLIKEALDRRRELLGEDNPDTIRSLNVYGGVLELLGRQQDAEPLYKQALDQRRRILGEDHPDTIESLHNYANVLKSLGRPQEAEPLFKKALEQGREVLGDDHPNTIIYLHNYGAVLGSLGRAQEGEPLYRAALDQSRKVLGEDHPETIASLHNYAIVLESLGRAEEAEPLFKQAFSQNSIVLGEDHPDTITSLNNYATVLESLGRPQEAEPHRKHAYQLRRKALGNTHPDTIRALISYANVLASMGREPEAEPLFKEAFEQHRTMLGVDHPDTIDSLNSYASVLGAMDRAREAEPLFKQALELAKRNSNLGVRHSETQKYAGNLATCLDALNRKDEATAIRKEFGMLDESKSHAEQGIGDSPDDSGVSPSPPDKEAASESP